MSRTHTEGTGYLTITRISGDPDGLEHGYRRSAGVMSEVGRDHGLIAHTAAKAENGIVIVNLWPSKDGSESAAADQRRANVIQEHGLEPSRMLREHHDVFSCVVFD